MTSRCLAMLFLLLFAPPVSGEWELEEAGSGTVLRVAMSVAPEGGVHVLLQEAGSDEVRYLTDAAGDWGVPELVWAAAGSAEFDVGTDDAGRPLAAIADTGFSALVFASLSERSWISTIATGLNEPAGAPSLAIDRDGSPHISYPSDSSIVNVALDGAAWAVATVSAGVPAGNRCALVVDDGGSAHVTFGESRLIYASLFADSWTAVEVDTTMSSGASSSIGVDRAGALHVAYLGAGGEEVRYAVRSGGSWSLETIDAFPGGFSLSARSLALDGEGIPHVLYTNATTDEMIHAARIGGGGVWVRETAVAPSSDDVELFGFGIDGGGVPHAVYANRTEATIVHAFGEPAIRLSTLTLDRPFPLRRYFMLSLPVVSRMEETLGDALSSLGLYGDRTWRGFTISGGDLVENPEAEIGMGYLVALAEARDPAALTGWPMPAGVTVELEPGWNMVGVPRHTGTFRWADVAVRTDTGSALFGDTSATAGYLAPYVWWYADESGDLVNDDSYEVRPVPGAGSLDNEWGGYYLYAYRATAITYPDILSVPKGKGGETSPFAAETAEWEICIAASPRGGRSGGVVVGARRGAAPGADGGDLMKPPAVGAGLRVDVVQHGAPWPYFLRAWSPPGADAYRWSVELSGGAGTADLRWSGVESVPERYGVYLVDPAGGPAVDLRRSRSHSVVVPEGGRMLEVLVTTEPVEDEILTAPHTGVAMLGPNPARGSFAVRFETAAAGQVDVGVYDVAGRRVATLLRKSLDRGRHDAEWDGAGSTLAPGVYFVRVDTPDGSISKKITIVH